MYFFAWRRDPSGMWRQNASHCAFAKWDFQSAMFTPGASKIRNIQAYTVTAHARSMFEDASSVGCGLGLPRIAYLAKWNFHYATFTPGASKI